MSSQLTSNPDRGAHGPSALAWARTIPGGIVALALLLAGSWFLLNGLLEIINFGFRQPMFDQFKMYPNYLMLPFPDSVLQLENGHRPIFPNLVQVAEAQWFSANQNLQLAVGGGSALLMAALLAIAAWRAPDTSLPVRAACVASSCIGIFWLGNARMLLHGSELLHVYLPGLFLLLGALAVHRAAQASPMAWTSAATVCCLCATFSFGSGIAAFPALAIVAWYARVPARAIGILGLGIAVALVVYLWILPGDDGVRDMLVFRPIDSAATAMRWIASPWINAWLGFAEPPLYPWMASSASSDPIAHWLSVSANTIQSLLHLDNRQTGAIFVGLAGSCVAGYFLVRQAIRREPLAPVHCLVFALVLFVGAVSAIIGIGRVGNFIALPDDVFADRYLPWSCMFWIGLGFLLLLQADQSSRRARAVALAIALAIPIVLMPSQQNWAGWGEAVYRIGQRAGAAAISDVFDASVFPDDDSAQADDVLRTLELLQQRKLAMFSIPGSGRLGEKIGIGESSTDVAIWMDNTELLTDARTGLPGAHVRGIVMSGIRRTSKAGTLLIIDESNRIVGYALPSFVGKEGTTPRIHMPRKRGFDGYIRNYSADQRYRLAVLDPDSGISIPLSPIPSPAK